MAGEKLDYKKAYKDLYRPGTQPCLIEVPVMRFIMVDGQGDPNAEGGAYGQAIDLLYALSYTIKMSKMSGAAPEGHFEYVVPPLEGLWWMADGTPPDFANKSGYCWTSMIRQPEFAAQPLFDWACGEVARKKAHLDVSKARFALFDEGLCAQAMHLGPYDDEPATIARLEAFIEQSGHRSAIGGAQADGTILRHHEIYLTDPRKTAPEKNRTVIRHPIRAGR